MASRLCSCRPTCPPTPTPPLLQLQLPLPHSAQPDSPGAESVTQRGLEQGGEEQRSGRRIEGTSGSSGLVMAQIVGGIR